MLDSLSLQLGVTYRVLLVVEHAKILYRYRDTQLLQSFVVLRKPTTADVQVVERIEQLLGQSLLSHLLAAVRCDTLEVFIDSVHCCDLVCRMPHPDEPAAVLCSRFSPLGDLRNSLDMRLRRLAGLLTDSIASAAAAAEKNPEESEKTGEPEKEGEPSEKATAEVNKETAVVAVKEKAGPGNRNGSRKSKNRGKRGNRGPAKNIIGPGGTPQHALRLASLLRDHQLMWGYGFVPAFCGTASIIDTVTVFLSDMVEETGAAGGARWVRVSPETLMRYMIQDQLQQAEMAIVDAEDKKLQAGDDAAAAEKSDAEKAQQAEAGQETGAADADAPMHEAAATGAQVEGEGEGDNPTDDDIEVLGEEAAEKPVGGESGAVAACVKQEQEATDEGTAGVTTAAVTEGGTEEPAAVAAGAADAEKSGADGDESAVGEKEKEQGADAEKTGADGDAAAGEEAPAAGGDADMAEEPAAEASAAEKDGEADAAAQDPNATPADRQVDADASEEQPAVDAEAAAVPGDGGAEMEAPSDAAAAATEAADAAAANADTSAEAVEGADADASKELAAVGDAATVGNTEGAEMEGVVEEGGMPLAGEDRILQVRCYSFRC